MSKILDSIIRNVDKKQRSWILYDWANSAYSIIITTAILPLYYKSVANPIIGETAASAYWSFANSFGSLLVAALGPILGAIADFEGLKKRLFAFFALLGISFTLLLSIVPSTQWIVLLIIYFVTVVGFAGANIFYDAFLVDISEKKDMDRISSMGFAFGYLGSMFPFAICIALSLTGDKFGLDGTAVARISFVITALWWGLFSIPIFKNVHQENGKPRQGQVIGLAFKSVFTTLKHIISYKGTALFLLAYFFYIDGVDTIIRQATIIGSDIGISANTMLIVLMLTQIVAFPFSILFGYLATKYKNTYLIYAALIVYIAICIYAMISLSSNLDFYILGFMIGTVQGGIQSLSRSYFGKIIPKDKSNEFFGFYNILGKFSAVLGPAFYGTTLVLTGSVSAAIGSILILFVAGIIIFTIANKYVVQMEDEVI